MGRSTIQVSARMETTMSRRASFTPLAKRVFRLDVMVGMQFCSNVGSDVFLDHAMVAS